MARWFYLALSLALSLLAEAQMGRSFPRVQMHYVQLQQNNDKSLIHTVFAVDGSSLVASAQEDGTYTGAVRIELLFTQEDSLVFGDAFEMYSPAVKDSSALQMTFLHQNRYLLEDGQYQLRMRVNDLANKGAVQEIQTEIDIRTEREQITLSDPLLFVAEDPKKQPDPLLPSGDYFIAQNISGLHFNCEVYNLEGSAEGSVLLRYYLSDQKEEVLSEYGSFKRLAAAADLKLNGGLNISELPRGLYYLHLDLLSRKGDTLDSHKILFYRQSDIESEDYAEHAQLLDGTDWLPPLSEKDSLRSLVDMLHPIANALERRQIDQLLENGSDLQRRRFIAGFWSQRYGAQSADRFRSYLSAVRSVNARFDARTTPGYKTDRGRVELQYGRPDLIEDRKYEPSTYPYEIWQYNRLRSESTQNQVNKVFIFANLSSAGDQYELIHSNAFGEVFNPRWSLVLNKRILPGMDIDETGSDIIQHGGRSNSNLIINGGSLDRVNRR